MLRPDVQVQEPKMLASMLGYHRCCLFSCWLFLGSRLFSCWLFGCCLFSCWLFLGSRLFSCWLFGCCLFSCRLFLGNGFFCCRLFLGNGFFCCWFLRRYFFSCRFLGCCLLCCWFSFLLCYHFGSPSVKLKKQHLLLLHPQPALGFKREPKPI